jgi:hypothetical protein
MAAVQRDNTIATLMKSVNPFPRVIKWSVVPDISVKRMGTLLTILRKMVTATEMVMVMGMVPMEMVMVEE